MQNAQRCLGGLLAPQAFASHDSSVQLKNAHAESVWLVSHHQPAGEAAYSREAYVGQQGAFVKGRCCAKGCSPQSWMSRVIEVS
jgi:hypothetical protein